MNKYPDLKWEKPAYHLLFDLGWSYGLLHSLQGFLRRARAQLDTPHMRIEIDELLGAIQGLQEGRLQLRSEIYDNAEPAVAIDARLAALDKIVEAADAPGIVISVELANAIAHAKKVTGKGLPELRTK